MIKLTGDNAFFVPPKNRYGLSKKETFDLTEKDFTFTVKVKINWKSMITGTATHEGGIVAKNGSGFAYPSQSIYIENFSPNSEQKKPEIL